MTISRALLIWAVLFLASAGLGYPTLARYDPRTAPGVTDAAEYAQLVKTARFADARTLQERPRPRLMVPWVARAVLSVIQGETRSADAVMLALLIANALFCATAAMILIDLALRLQVSDAVALFAATLYLLNFAVPNFAMSAMVDSGEACMMLAVTWALFTQRWFLLPVLGAIGAFGKETFLPFAVIYVGTWWYLQPHGDDRLRWARLVWVLIMTTVTAITLVAVWSAWYHQLVAPWLIATVQHANNATFLEGLWNVVTSHGLLYVFGWLLPLGAWKLRELPREWSLSIGATAAFAILLGAWDDSGSNIARALFNIAGPILTLSAALLLAGERHSREDERHSREDGNPAGTDQTL